MEFVIVLNSKSSSPASGFCESKAGATAVATDAVAFEIDLVLPFDVILIWRLYLPGVEPGISRA